MIHELRLPCICIFFFSLHILFALRHTYYARWMSVFIHSTQQSVSHQFLNGKFTVVKSNNNFSFMAHDQVHEQNNKMVKVYGGAIGLLQNPKALMNWMVSDPEISQILVKIK